MVEEAADELMNKFGTELLSMEAEVVVTETVVVMEEEEREATEEEVEEKENGQDECTKESTAI